MDSIINNISNLFKDITADVGDYIPEYFNPSSESPILSLDIETFKTEIRTMVKKSIDELKSEKYDVEKYVENYSGIDSGMSNDGSIWRSEEVVDFMDDAFKPPMFNSLHVTPVIINEKRDNDGTNPSYHAELESVYRRNSHFLDETGVVDADKINRYVTEKMGCNHNEWDSIFKDSTGINKLINSYCKDDKNKLKDILDYIKKIYDDDAFERAEKKYEEMKTDVEYRQQEMGLDSDNLHGKTYMNTEMKKRQNELKED